MAVNLDQSGYCLSWYLKIAVTISLESHSYIKHLGMRSVREQRFHIESFDMHSDFPILVPGAHVYQYQS